MMRRIIMTYALLLATAIVPGAYDRGACAEAKGEKVSVMSEQNGGVRKAVEFENDRVRIVRFHFDPHARVPLHDAPDLVAIWLTGARLKLTFADGTSKIEMHQAGETEWAPAQKPAGENVADTPLEFIAVQMK